MVRATDNSLRGIRDKGILLVAYDSLCRRGELVSLELEDVLIEDKSIKLKLRKSKTDPDGIGKSLYLSNDTQIALKNWVKKSRIESGKLFRSITTSGKIKESLNSAQIARIYKKLAINLKVDQDIIKRISGHSTRVGAAQDLMASGTSLPIIMNRGRWSKIDTVMRYVEASIISK
jgi:integrase